MEIASNSMAIATVYDRQGQIIAIGRAQAEPVNIAQGSKVAFGIVITEKLQSYEIKGYSIVAESNNYISIQDTF
jgi:hypothetical protein